MTCPEEEHSSVMRMARRSYWCGWRMRCFAISPTARITMVRSPKASWSATPCAALGITPASTCGRAKPCVPRHSSPVACWTVEQRDGKIFVRRSSAQAETEATWQTSGAAPEKIVIVGGGAAGFAAVEMLRREQYQGSIVMLSNDDAPPVDRPNLSKDYLAGKAPDDWVPLRPESFYSENGIDLRLKANVAGIDARSREVVLADGGKVPYDRLLLATGAEPVRLSIPGADQPHVHTLRSLADCRAIIERAKTARRAVVLGASFIGLEVAAALRAREIEVHVVAPDKRPMERILVRRWATSCARSTRSMGSIFHLEDTASRIDGKQVSLKSGRHARSGSRGCRYRRASADGACRSKPGSSRSIAVSSWTPISKRVRRRSSRRATLHAGQIPTAARAFASSIGWLPSDRGKPRRSTCSGTARNLPPSPSSGASTTTSRSTMSAMRKWDELAIDGDITGKDCLMRFKRKGRVAAVASIFRDHQNLLAELMMEREVA